MKKLLISSAVVLALVSSCAVAETVYNKDGSVNASGSIRSASLQSDSQNLPEIKYNEQAPMPGQVRTYKKSFVTAPPMIPHSIKGMTPIRIGKNQCIGCHMPQVAKAMHIISIPESHFVDNFKNGKKVGVKLAGARYNCTQCHAPQAKLDPVVQNKFNSLRR
jgi:cytochrome c-type protein NapB